MQRCVFAVNWMSALHSNRLILQDVVIIIVLVVQCSTDATFVLFVLGL